MNAYDRLIEANINVVSVKTDCFTIPAKDEQLARQILTFDQGIGTWRVSKTKDIIFPFETLKRTPLNDITIEHLHTNELTVIDEWSADEMCDNSEK